MLRDFQNTLNKPANSTFKADSDMVTGMGVVKDHTNKTIDFPEAETASGIFLVDKERVLYGLDAARGDISDYDKAFTEVAKGEFVKLPAFDNQGEAFGTDQYVATGLAINDRVSVGTDGKWKKAGASVSSRYIYTGTYKDNGYTLARIEVATEAAVNA